MKRSNKTSISLSDDELAILDCLAARNNISRSTIVRHWVLYHAMCGGSMPLTSKILDLKERDQDQVISDIRKRAEADEPFRTQKFRQWVMEGSKGTDPDAVADAAAGTLLQKLLNEHYQNKTENEDDRKAC